MPYRLQHTFQEYDLRPWYDIGPHDEVRTFVDTNDAFDFLRRFTTNPDAMAALRERAARYCGPSLPAWRRTDQDIVSQLAWRLHRRELVLVVPAARHETTSGAGSAEITTAPEDRAEESATERQAQAPATGTRAARAGTRDRSPAAAASSPRSAPPALLPGIATHWIEFQLIDDETGEPISGVDLKVLLPGGMATTLTTGPDGKARVDDVDDGTCDLEEVLDNRAFEIVSFE